MKIQIKYINGIRFKRFIMTSAQRIIQNKEHLNNINVFPVADGDTGTNLAITMNNIVEGVQDFYQSSFDLTIQRIAKSALKGARGNSGAILAQFFQGLAEATRGMNRLNTVSFSQAALKAAEQADMAIAEPCEGTIITVIRDWAHYINQLAHKTPDFVELFKSSLNKARKSLLETPEKLAVLKHAGVVDAGAEGFVNLLEGIVDYIEFGKLRNINPDTPASSNISRNESYIRNLENSQYRYCTECLLEGENLDREIIREKLINMGNSQVVAGSKEQIRVHIHTNNPDLVFAEISVFGTILETKIDDMWEQAVNVRERIKSSKIGLMADSTCDLPEELIEKYNIKIVPIAVQIDEQNFLDRVNISAKEVVNFLESKSAHVTTSQPPYQYFEDVFQELGETKDSIISIHLSGKLSGTYQSACVAGRKNKYHEKIKVIDAKTSSVGLGLIVLQAARLIEEGIPLEELLERLNYHIENSKIFVSIPTLEYLIRSGRLDKMKGFIGSLINLKPVITLNEEGVFEEAAKVVGLRRLSEKTLELACQFADSVKNPHFAIAHVQDINIAKWYQQELKIRFPDAEIFIAEGSPALSVHIGRGGAAIAVMGC